MHLARRPSRPARRPQGSAAVLAGLLLLACSSPDEGGDLVGTGGAALGGALTGGLVTGGLPASGGASSTGGAGGSGGATMGGAGGAVPGVGGTSTGGGPAAGGSGGASAGGASSGGWTTGGGWTGGASSGGWATGGSTTGGAGLGGWATGGSTTGGASSGGWAATGGSTMGGAELGGAATGGWTMGGETATGGEPSGGAASGGDGSGGATSGGGAGGAAATTPITLWIAGDSTVANGNTPCPTGWGKVFDPLFNDLVTVVNSAIGGRSVRNWLYSVSDTMGADGECVINTDAGGAPVIQSHWQAMLDGMSAGDYLFVQFGINDGSATCNRHVGVEEFKNECAMMAAAARERGANPVFVTPVSAVACDGSSARTTRDTYANATLQVGAEQGVPVIDLHQLSVALYDELGFCPIPGGDVSAGTTGPVGDFFCDDHTHFSATGAPVIAGLVADAVRAQGLPLAEYLD